MPRKPDLPASKLIRFLSSYGPDASNVNMFDEKVNLLSQRYHIPPFKLHTEYVERICELLRRPTPTGILVAGVAGDGKSYHLKQVWKSLGGDEALWNENGDKSLSIEIENGTVRQIEFITDLSAHDANFDEFWNKIQSSEDNPQISFIIACNHGQILSRLREMPAFEALADKLEDTFFQCDTEKTIRNLHIFDLSRTSQSAKLKEIIRLICTHAGWSACQEKSCPYLMQCPILRNLRRLWNYADSEPTQALRRLCQVVEIAGFDGNHFPIRELYLLAVNAILGASSLSDTLANCHYVKRLAEGLESKDIDLYENLLGYNLSESHRKGKTLFRALGLFEIGCYSDRYFDELIVLGKSHPDPQIRTLYEKYLGHLPSLPPQADEEQRQRCIEQARRILFFAWEEPHHEQNLWNLTAYRHAPQYLRMKAEAREDDQIEQPVIDGLNRIMTGSALTNGKLIKVSTNGADSRTPIGLLVVGKINADRDYDGVASIVYNAKGADAVPELVFALGNQDDEDGNICFALTPRRYEFLASLAEGYLSTSFSSQCQTEFYSLKARLVRATEKRAKKRTKSVRLDLIDTSSIIIRIDLAKEA